MCNDTHDHAFVVAVAVLSPSFSRANIIYLIQIHHEHIFSHFISVVHFSFELKEIFHCSAIVKAVHTQKSEARNGTRQTMAKKSL